MNMNAWSAMGLVCGPGALVITTSEATISGTLVRRSMPMPGL